LRRERDREDEGDEVSRVAATEEEEELILEGREGEEREEGLLQRERHRRNRDDVTVGSGQQREQ